MRTILTFSFIALFCLFASNSTAQITVNVGSGGGLETALKAQQPNLQLVTDLTVTGQMDAQDFRFIRDSLNSTLVSLDLGACTIVAYSGMGGTDYTGPNMFGVGGGADKNATYAPDVIPINAFYKAVKPNMFTTNEVKMTALTSLALPLGATKIDTKALAGMVALVSLDLSVLTQCSEIVNNVFTLCSALQTVTLPNTLTTIGNAPFAGCSSLQSLTIPNSVDSVANTSGFFEGCTSLASVAFAEPCQITTLPYRMFYSSAESSLRLSALMSVTVPSSVTNISTAFEDFAGTSIGCHPSNTVYESIDGVLYLRSNGNIAALPKGITSFTVPASWTTIPDEMFNNCTNLTSVDISAVTNLTRIGHHAFARSAISSFTFPSTLQEIGEYAFAETKLDTVRMTNNPSLTVLGENIFNSCADLEYADISGITTLGNRMFTICSKLDNIILNNTITAIPIGFASGCTALQSITIPNSVTTIGARAFISCDKLQNINLPSSLTTLGNAAFSNDTLIATFNLPASFTTLINSSGIAFTGTRALITVDEANPLYAAEDGMLLNKSKSKLYHVPGYTDMRNVIIPATVDTIDSYAFDNDWGKIRKVTLPAALEYIGNNGLRGVAKIDTLVVTSIVPPVCADQYYSLYNDYLWSTEYPDAPLVLLPPRTLDAYSTAPGWKNYKGTTNSGIAYNFLVSQNVFVGFEHGYATAVSPNGNYVVGVGENSAYIWEYSEGVAYIPNSTGATDINDMKMIAGTFFDNDYIVNGQPLKNGGVYRDGRWYSLGLGRYGNSTNTAEATAVPGGITANGSVYGMTLEHNNLARVSPFIWNYNAGYDDYKHDTLTWAAPFDHSINDQGGRFSSVSSDGTVASGWVSRKIYGGARSAIVWTSPTTYKMLDETTSSEGAGVSRNGKYVATSKGGRAAVYDVENDTLIVFGSPDSKSVSVSNNGFVVGYASRGTDMSAGRKAFIWSDKLGYMYFDQFLSEYCPDAVLPDDPIFSFSPTEARFDVAMSISSDGLVIAGWSGYTSLARNGWVLCLAQELDLIDRPRKLVADVVVEDRNKAVLTWDEPTDYGTHSLDFYFIYRDGVKVGEVEPYQGATFTDENIPAGSHNYNVSAVYDYVNSSDYLESSWSDYVDIAIVDNYDLPFQEDFERGYENNYWTKKQGHTAGWLMFDGTGFAERYSALFLTSGDRQPYDYSLISKPFDATGVSNVTLSYLYRINSNIETWLGVRDTVKVEISTGIGNNATWNVIQTIVIDNVITWTPVTMDISPYAANSQFRIRFHSVSGANRNLYNFLVDNIGVSLETNNIAPEGVLAYKYAGHNEVHVLCKDRTGAYALSQMEGSISQTIGNKGHKFIAAHKFDQLDIKPLINKYLTSISAFVWGDRPNTTVETKLKLAVWVNGNRVESGDISSYEGDAWNTFKLATPILLTDYQTIIAGIEVAQHDSLNYPLAFDNTDSLYVNTKGNLLSYNDGATWRNPNITEGYPGMWAITANIRDEATAQTVDKDATEIAYQIIKNNTVMPTLSRKQHFVDKNNTSTTDCYKVKSFCKLGGLSPESAQGCVNILNDIPIVEINTLNVYPNPATDIVHIDIDFNILKIYDVNGKMVMQTTDKQVNISHLVNGVYLFEAKQTNGTKYVARVIKK